jgi:hypothetical protein
MRSLRCKLATAALAGALSMAPAVPTLAASHHPKGEYAPFAECPLSVKTLTDCVYSLSTKGGFTVGSEELPLINPLILQGGFEGGGDEVIFHGAENGETLSSAPQPLVGLFGGELPASWPQFLQDWFEAGVRESGGIIATVELAVPASEVVLNTEALLLEEGTALGLPVKIKLKGKVLGSHCYVGSASEPLQLKYTTGPSGALNGSSGTLTFNRSMTMSTIAGGRLVDGTFTAPGASGCGGLLSNFVDPLVDSTFALPSQRGQNTAVLEGKLQDAQAEAVRASE